MQNMRLRRTDATIKAENERILQLMRMGVPDSQIKKEVRLNDRNYQMRIHKLGQNSLNEILDKQSAEQKALLLGQCVDTIKALSSRAYEILRSEDLKPLERAAIMDRIRQYSLDIARLNTEGPYLFDIIRDGLLRRADNQSIVSEDSPPLPAVQASNSQSSADPNAVF